MESSTWDAGLKRGAGQPRSTFKRFVVWLSRIVACATGALVSGVLGASGMLAVPGALAPRARTLVHAQRDRRDERAGWADRRTGWPLTPSVEVLRLRLHVPRHLGVNDLALAVRVQRNAAVVAELRLAQVAPQPDFGDADLA